MPVENAAGLESLIIWVKVHLFLKNYVTEEEAVSHNVLYISSPLLVTKYVFMLTIMLSN